MFNNQDLVINSFLNGVDQANAKAIYTDATLGMDSVTKLFYWFLACSSDKDPSAITAYNAIVANFQAKGIDLTADKMKKLVGPQSPFKMIYTTLSITF